jgi:hypothetical protein
MADLKKVSVTGTLMYTSTGFKLDRESGDEKQELTVSLNDAQVGAITKENSARKVRTFEEHPGLKFMKFSRPKMSAAGKEMNPAGVYNADGTPFEGYLGNGTIAKVELVIIPTKKKTAIRPNRIDIIKLVEYTPKTVEVEELGATLITEAKTDIDITDVF